MRFCLGENSKKKSEKFIEDQSQGFGNIHFSVCLLIFVVVVGKYQIDKKYTRRSNDLHKICFIHITV